MKIETVFSCGDKGWVCCDGTVRQLTIGEVSVKVTESPGIDGEMMWDNYKPSSGYTEGCMCVETGIGSGSLYTVGESIFLTEAECVAANYERIAEHEREKAAHKARVLLDLLAREDSLRRDLARIEAAKLEQAVAADSAA